MKTMMMKRKRAAAKNQHLNAVIAKSALILVSIGRFWTKLTIMGLNWMK
jgi:hypothetical protein